MKGYISTQNNQNQFDQINEIFGADIDPNDNKDIDFDFKIESDSKAHRLESEKGFQIKSSKQHINNEVSEVSRANRLSFNPNSYI